jgi:hypothetical protein
VDRANDCLAGCCESAHEPTNFECRLPVKTGSRLVQEQQRWFRDKLSRKRESLALLDRKTETGTYTLLVVVPSKVVERKDSLPTIACCRLVNSKRSMILYT